MRRNETFNQYPLQEINRIRVESRKRTFSSDVEEQDKGQKITVPKEKKTDVSLSTTNELKPVVNIPNLPNFNLNVQDPTLLGSNPIEAAKNMQILQRRNQ